MAWIETDETIGLSLRDLVLETRDDVKQLKDEGTAVHARIDRDVAQRPTRADLTKTVGLSLTAIAIGVAILASTIA